MQYDVIIIGGSYAGLSAAMPLARARRRILVVDEGLRRNRFAAHSHGFLTQDGNAPGAIASQAREQVMAYETVEWLTGKAVAAALTERGLRVDIEGTEPREARRIIFAGGVVDQLPEIPGLAERWGNRVFHCPYCHGYELQQGRIGVIATSAMSMHLALLLPDWGRTTLFLNEAFEPDPEQLAMLAARGVTLEREPVQRIDGELDVVLRDGRVISLDGLFVPTRIDVASVLPQMLGCEFDEGFYGRIIRTDAMKATSVKGVYACGDAARMGGSVPLAVGDGTLAGAAAHQSLIFDSH
ncbi:NAD(P)/FAD-dependent oxidoreductase [Pseudomonas tohonis]|uniref:NAD(P)/FAD-dependent oxidoreductase n=1 Tax=Pseudomonas tohonis TaxID=2725477 RepID=UPI0021D8FCE0|nr:NAD(P)/FAD-dependent oxidoreductase [Pseudomonas tohonis]UXY55128.1 NAD(P)/FAD-dependent oxidoreductase [Pseudomonas tohonis]